VVTLSGQVHSNAEKTAAETQAKTVEGATIVQNDIQVVEYRTNPSDH
jgi:osmotically-inducible protein OsmY